MSTPSIGESVASIADSLDGEEFLAASLFHPSNVDLRSTVHDSPRKSFQPRFARINSMDYRGQSIVENMNNTSPISCLSSRMSQRPHLRKPVAANRPAEAVTNILPLHSDHTQPRDKPLSGFMLDAGDPKAAYSSAPTRPKCATSSVPALLSTAAKVAAAKSSRQALKTSTSNSQTASGSEHTPSSDAVVDMPSASAFSCTDSAKRVQEVPTSRPVGSWKRATSGSESRETTPRSHPPRRTADSAATASVDAHRSGIVVHMPPQCEGVDFIHSDDAHITGTHRRGTVPAPTASAKLTPTLLNALSPYSSSPATRVPSAPSLLSRFRSVPVESSSSVGGAGSSPQRTSPEKCAATERSRASALLVPAGAANQAAVSPLSPEHISSMPSSNSQAAERDGSGGSAPLRQNVSKHRHSMRVLPQCSTGVHNTEKNDAAAVSIPMVSKASKAVSRNSTSRSQPLVATPSVAPDLAYVTRSSDGSPSAIARVPQPPAKVKSLKMNAPQPTAATQRHAAPLQLPARKILEPVPARVVLARGPEHRGTQTLRGNQHQERHSPIDLVKCNEKFPAKTSTSQKSDSLLNASGTDVSDSKQRVYFCTLSLGDAIMSSFARDAGDLHLKVNRPSIFTSAIRTTVKGPGGLRGAKVAPLAHLQPLPNPSSRRPSNDSASPVSLTPPRADVATAPPSPQLYSSGGSPLCSDSHSAQAPLSPSDGCRCSSRSPPTNVSEEGTMSVEPLEPKNILPSHSGHQC
ncbi:hypothetical protein, unknown function [Leishmania mexicana MHOM/GT/2001/U1103]|uniref:Uncharacterized protein n=1 Tax=Leishmania mexicana (strain MHOM/GT/2001/U1103) TaxID=929439 RepID=E9B6V1_LEIMU|nr:hypothetical protein, unknown function [Leishmania mexicana MHOM/GT/2001/U1103]CBZ30974.1 hypothetical protein, unknown function [Leishmania mexicana MHOM/GT/2001/U1103]